MQFHLYTAGSTTYTQISQVTTDQRNKPLMRQILRFTEESEICGSTSVQLVQLPTHSNTPDVSIVRNTGAIEQTMESEQCSSTSIQLVQLPTHSNIPGVPMVRNTRGSEDCWNYRMDNRIRAMQFHLYTAGSTP